MNKIKAIVFDMDGVLFDTERLYLESWKILGEQRKIEHIEETARKCIGLSVTDTVALLKNTYGENFPIEENHRIINQMAQERIERDGMPMKEGAEEILAYLYGRGLPIGLASSTAYKKIISHLERSKLKKYFSVIVGGDMIAKSKPDPEIYLTACRKLGVDPSEAVAVEDSRNGIISAYKAGLAPIMVPDLIEPTAELLEMAEVKLDTLFEVKAFLADKIV